MQNIHHFAKKESQATWSKAVFGKFSKKKPYLKEKTYGIDKILGGF
jgi:hypothetical protein